MSLRSTTPGTARQHPYSELFRSAFQLQAKTDADGVAKIVLESIQEMLLKLALQMAWDDFEDRRERQRQGIELAKAGGKYMPDQADW